MLTQALAAVWFYRLFRGVAPVAAGSITAFGLVNSVAIMGSAAMLATAVDIAHTPVGDAAASVQTLFLISGNLWGAGNLFFGLWLIPMAICVLQSRWMPRPLGWILIVGGVGYVLGGFIGFVFPNAQVVVDSLAWLASVGELWMVGYLLIRGIRRTEQDWLAGRVAELLRQGSDGGGAARGGRRDPSGGRPAPNPHGAATGGANGEEHRVRHH